MLLDRVGKRIANRCDFLRRELEQIELQRLCRLSMELLDLPMRRLNQLSSVMQFAEINERLVANFVRHTAARIVREPPAVRRPNQWWPIIMSDASKGDQLDDGNLSAVRRKIASAVDALYATRSAFTLFVVPQERFSFLADSPRFPTLRAITSN